MGNFFFASSIVFIHFVKYIRPPICCLGLSDSKLNLYYNGLMLADAKQLKAFINSSKIPKFRERQRPRARDRQRIALFPVVYL